jgi:hypothetical protein
MFLGCVVWTARCIRRVVELQLRHSPDDCHVGAAEPISTEECADAFKE